MRHKVLLTEGAERDLEEIYTHIAATDPQGNAAHVPDRLLEAAENRPSSPSTAPTRRNSWRSASANIAKPSSSPTASSTA